MTGDGDWDEECPFCLTTHTFLGHCWVPDAPAYVAYVDAHIAPGEPKFLYFAPCASVESAWDLKARVKDDPTTDEVRVWTRVPGPAKVNNNAKRDGFRYIRLDHANGDFEGRARRWL